MRNILFFLWVGLLFTPLVYGKISPPIAKKVMDVVVRIDITKSTSNTLTTLQEELNKSNTYGSGFIFHPDGYIATNLHILGEEVGSIQAIHATLSSGQRKEVKIIGYDKFLDLLVLKIDEKTLPSVTWGNSEKLPLTSSVYAFGHPLGLTNSIVQCFVSALNRNIGENDFIMASRSFPDGITRNLIQLDGNLNPGLSGGPVTNESGQVVGMSSSNFGNDTHSVGIGFCLPVNTIKSALLTIKTTKKSIIRGTLGVHVQKLDPSTIKKNHLQQLSGVLVTSIDSKSAASTSNLHVGDIILSLNGHAINDSAKLRYVVKSAPLGIELPISLYRDGHIVKKQILLLPDNSDVLHISPEVLSNVPIKSQNLGFSLKRLTPQLKASLGLSSSLSGLLVEHFVANDLNNAIHIQPGDIIKSVNNTDVSTTDEFDEALTLASKIQSTVVLSIKRTDCKTFETLKLR